MDSNRLTLYFHTLRKVTFTQVYYQVFYKFFSRFSKPKTGQDYKKSDLLEFKNSITNQKSYSKPATFQFLNLEHTFQKIDWNFNKFGKLWTYNLNYFDFLNQENISKEEGLELILNFCNSSSSIKDGYEPYPISLRGINWVVFLSRNQIKNSKINQQLFDDYWRLMNRIEYHILANHLIENGFSLLFGAYYFQNETFYKKAKKILTKELEEQILNDGAHYELSPMYHCIMLHRILDSYNLVTNNDWKNNELKETLKEKASLMLGWLEAIVVNNDIPMLNDSSLNIAPSPTALFEYAKQLAIQSNPIVLHESGYRKMKADKLEIIFDVGQIAPTYQPGHSHADSLQILVYSEKNPIIVDTGISTYEKNVRRQLERSTSSHNTVTINHLNSSQVWSGFRVGKRAHVTLVEEKQNSIRASHNGYRSFGVICERNVQSTENALRITDTITGNKKEDLIQGHLHLHPNVTFQLKDHILLLNDSIEIKFPKETQLKMENYFYCKGFNDLIKSNKVVYTFNQSTTFTIKQS